MNNSNKWSRRDVLRTGAIATGAAAMPSFFVRNAWADGHFHNSPEKSGKLVFGFNIPQTGPYADEGADELLAYQLAVKHINGEGDGGMLNTMSPLSLKGDGVNGMKVQYVTGDTQSKSDPARASAKRMIEKDGVIMFSGGSSSSVAIAVQSLAQEMGIVFMCGLTHSNDTTGKDKRRYGFRHFFNTHMSGAALGPVLEQMGNDRRAYHLTTDYTWGWSQEGSIIDVSEALGWETVNTALTPFGAGDFSQYITPVLNSGADVLILNQYGKDMVNSLTQAVQFGLRDKQVNGRNFEIVVPLYSRLMAQGVGEENIKGIYGTTNWNWSLKDEGSVAFVKSFGQEYGFPPSQAAHTCYVQALLYANACQTVGSFYPPEVIKQLEGFKFDGMGNGPTLYRAADHQCFKDVLLVRGNDNPASEFDLLEVVEIVPRKQVEYDPSIFGGELGPYKV